MESDNRNKICRLCLSEKETLIPIFEWKGIDGYAPADVIKDLLRHQVSASDMYPQTVCSVCSSKLRDFKQFKEQCDASIKLLNRAYGMKTIENTTIKPPEDVNTPSGEVVTSPQMESRSPVTAMETDPVADPPKEDISKVEDANVEYDDHNYSRVSQWPGGEINLDVVKKEPPECTGGDSRNPASSDDDNLSCYSEWEEEVIKTEPLTSAAVKTEDKVTNERSVAVEDSGDDNLSCYSEWEEEKVNGDAKPDANNKEGDYSDSSSTEEDSDDPWGEKKEKQINERTKKNVGENNKGPKKIFKCPMCERAYSSYRSFKSHVDEHKYGRNLECNQCGRKYFLKAQLMEHLKTHSEVKVDCPICNKTMKNRISLRSHLKLHKDKRFKCETCDKAFHTTNGIQRHMLTHSRLKIYACDRCDKKFHTKTLLMNHQRVHSGGHPKKHKCAVCGHLCASKTALDKHSFKHGGIKPFSCKYCEKRFTSKYGMEKHTTAVHEFHNRDNVQCEDCGKSYTNICSLVRHKTEFHLGLKRYKCDGCGVAYTQKHNLVNHIRKYHS